MSQINSNSTQSNIHSELLDVVIVGGAAVGSAAAYFLSAHPGFTGSVRVIEADPSYQQCATTRSVVSSIILIFMTNVFLSLILY